MKKILLLSIIAAGSLLINTPASAQFRLSVNIGMQPAWGPAGYDYAKYYYLPDVEAYYSVTRRQFIYSDRGNWVYAASLPGSCGNYDLYSGYKVVMNGRDPWDHFADHRVQYAPYRFRHDQVIIRDGRHYSHGGNYGSTGYDNRNKGRDWSYNDRDNNDHRQDRGRDGDRRDDHGHGNDHDDHGRGRW